MIAEKTSLIFLPGLLNDEALWALQIVDQADIANASVGDLTQDDSIAGMARRVLSQAPDRFALAALSMGGYVAFEIMRQAPERVSRLALFDTSAAPDDEERNAQRRANIESLKFGRFVGVTNRLLPRLIHSSKLGTSVATVVQEMALRIGGEAFIRQQTAILERPDARALLASIKVPTLVAVGDSDVMTPPPHAREIHQGIRNATLHVFKDCGHLPALELPGETSTLLRTWLQTP
ncbi:MAG: alpha/beta fold hydrolase [Janthinobacterium lividum]